MELSQGNRLNVNQNFIRGKWKFEFGQVFRKLEKPNGRLVPGELKPGAVAAAGGFPPKAQILPKPQISAYTIPHIPKAPNKRSPSNPFSIEGKYIS